MTLTVTQAAVRLSEGMIAVACLAMASCSPINPTDAFQITRSCHDGSVIVRDPQGGQLYLRSRWSDWSGYHYEEVAPGSDLGAVCP